MNEIDWSNVGSYSRGYGWALDHNLTYLVDRDFLSQLIVVFHATTEVFKGICMNELDCE